MQAAVEINKKKEEVKSNLEREFTETEARQKVLQGQMITHAKDVQNQLDTHSKDVQSQLDAEATKRNANADAQTQIAVNNFENNLQKTEEKT